MSALQDIALNLDAEQAGQEHSAPATQMGRAQHWFATLSIGSKITLFFSCNLAFALLAGLGNDHELAMHIRATANTGASQDDVLEALLHVAIYAGVPAANRAFKIAKHVFDKLDAGETGGGSHD